MGARIAINRRWVAVGMIVGLCALGLAGSVAVRVSAGGCRASARCDTCSLRERHRQCVGCRRFRYECPGQRGGTDRIRGTKSAGVGGRHHPERPRSGGDCENNDLDNPLANTVVHRPQRADAGYDHDQSGPGCRPTPVAGVRTGYQPGWAVRLHDYRLRFGSAGRGPSQPWHACRDIPAARSTTRVGLRHAGGEPEWSDGLPRRVVRLRRDRAEVLAIPLAAGGTSGKWAPGGAGTVNAIAVTPDGSQLYAAGTFGTEAIGTVPSSGGVFPSAQVSTRVTDGRSVAITPDGVEVYVGGTGLGLATFAVVPVSQPQPAGTTVPVPVEAERSGISGLAIMPDSSEVIADDGRSGADRPAAGSH